MATTVEYALMAGRAYQITRDPINQFPTLLGWAELDHVPNNPGFPQFTGVAGFEAVAFRKGTDIVISYAGTYDKDITGDIFADIGLATGVGSAQLLQAAEYYLQVKAANSTATSITFTGHSLGGGLAALMGVFFGQQAVTFDQAPFANSASAVMRDFLVSNLLALQDANQQPLYTSQQLMALAPALFTSNFNPVDLANSNVTTLRVVGEFISSLFPVSSFSPIGPQTPLSHGPTDISMFDLHAQSLLAAFVQNDQFRQVTFKLTDLLGMIFDSNLYKRDTAGTLENFLERLVRHQNGNAPGVATADAMLTRFTDDLWKLAQDGGLTMADDPAAASKFVSKALTAFAMQMYYQDTANATNKDKELFTEVSGGVQFDRADVAGSLGDAKGYTLYFQNYLNSGAFSSAELQLIQSLLPTLRDWYVQAGDASDRNSFERSPV